MKEALLEGSEREDLSVSDGHSTAAHGTDEHQSNAQTNGARQSRALADRDQTRAQAVGTQARTGRRGYSSKRSNTPTLERSYSEVRVAPENKRGWDGEYGRLERLDMDPINHPYHVDGKRKTVDDMNTHNQMVVTSKESYAWILTVIIGIVVALIARCVQFSIYTLCNFRNSYIQDLIVAWPGSRSSLAAPFTGPFVFFLVWNFGFTLVAGILTAVFEPHTAADGIAEIKAFFNGTHVKHFLRLRTIMVRIVGTVLTAASGIASGSEGPLIHIGAGVGSGVTRGDKMRNNGLLEFAPTILGLFHNDRDRREFVSAGAAAGMAAAFGSPIGGVLWVLEETSNAWTPGLVWRMFTAALAASVTLAFLRAGISSGDISVSGMLSFSNLGVSTFSLAQSSVASPIYWWEIFLYAAVVAPVLLGGARVGPRDHEIDVAVLVKVAQADAVPVDW